ncbi:hypothetical protein MTO96_044869 [Rhipicephalus appendiculatus]
MRFSSRASDEHAPQRHTGGLILPIQRYRNQASTSRATPNARVLRRRRDCRPRFLFPLTTSGSGLEIVTSLLLRPQRENASPNARPGSGTKPGQRARPNWFHRGKKMLSPVTSSSRALDHRQSRGVKDQPRRTTE